MANSPPTPWWEIVQLRDEINDGRGRIDDVQASLHDAVFGRADGARVCTATPTSTGRSPTPPAVWSR